MFHEPVGRSSERALLSVHHGGLSTVCLEDFHFPLHFFACTGYKYEDLTTWVKEEQPYHRSRKRLSWRPVKEADDYCGVHEVSQVKFLLQKEYSFILEIPAKDTKAICSLAQTCTHSINTTTLTFVLLLLSWQDSTHWECVRSKVYHKMEGEIRNIVKNGEVSWEFTGQGPSSHSACPATVIFRVRGICLMVRAHQGKPCMS